MVVETGINCEFPSGLSERQSGRRFNRTRELAPKKISTAKLLKSSTTNGAFFVRIWDYHLAVQATGAT
jgi:hypothetical protein